MTIWSSVVRRFLVSADESIDNIDDLPRLKSRYEFVNIKLDKTVV